MEFTGLDCHIDGQSYKRALKKVADGHIKVDEAALDLNLVERTFRRAVSSHGGDVWRRVRDRQTRVGTVSDRPIGSTPVRGSGLALYGPSRTRPKSGWELADYNYFASRNDAINKKQAKYYAYWSQRASAAVDAPDRVLLDWEKHQALTGGGYDNGDMYEIYNTAMKFVDHQAHLPELSPEQWGYVVSACHDLREHFVNCGMRLGSLSPTPYSHVRAEQSTDGVIGFPIYEKGNLEFSQKVARAIDSATGIKLYDYIGKTVEDPDTGYVGKFRNQDAVAAMLDSFNVGMWNCAPLVTIFARIQRHGYKIESDKLEPKEEKARAVFVPDAIHGSIGAMIGDAFQAEIMRCSVPDFPSLMKPDDQRASVWSLVEEAAKNDFVVLSTDESQYDSTLINDVMATIIDLVIRPFFKPEYDAWVDATIASLVYKVLVFPDAALSYLESKGSGISKHERIKGSVLIPALRGGLISGHKLTHILGSMYGMVVCQRCFAYENGFVVPPNQRYGVMAGDDNAMKVPRSLVDLSSAEGTYSIVESTYAKYGIMVNPAKQIHIVDGDEPLTIFLQTAYHYGLGIKGEGSSARPLAGVHFGEYAPRDMGMAMQLLGQISVMNNAATSRYREEAVSMWLEDDPLLTSLLQDQGSKAWDILISLAGGIDKLLMIPETGAFAFAVDRETLKRGEPLPIVETMVSVAQGKEVTEEGKREYAKLMAEYTA